MPYSVRNLSAMSVLGSPSYQDVLGVVNPLRTHSTMRNVLTTPGAYHTQTKEVKNGEESITF